MTTYEIATINGQYLREDLRQATEDNLDQVMDAAASYLGRDEERETWDDGRVVQGPITATPVREEAA